MTTPVIIPDIGGASDVTVIEIHVQPGDKIQPEQSLISLESEKATMDVPAPQAGQVVSLAVAVGDKVSEGDVILQIEAEAGAEAAPAAEQPVAQASVTQAAMPQETAAALVPENAVLAERNRDVYAGPAVRRMAHEHGVDLSMVSGTGPKQRIQKHDVTAYIQQQLASAQSGGAAASLPDAPKADFSKFGETEAQPLSKIKKYSGANLHRNWLSVPHVTQFEQADITELEAFRQQHKAELAEQGVKLTPIVFVIQAVVAALKAFPEVNASLSADGESLIIKKYYNVGVAVDTPNGLMVPVLRDVDQKSVTEMAQELAEISAKARESGLTPAEMSGSCFTISSLGGIGGTYFTPIVNAPDVAILGLSRSSQQPVYQDGEFVPRLMLPLSLSYDHRVIDGAQGARFLVCLADQLAKPASELTLT